VGKSQRTKGATFEREVAQLFSTALGLTAKRNIGQARDGGNDITIGGLVIECKRRKSLKTLTGWLAQAGKAAFETSANVDQYARKVPIVVARQDAGEPIVLLSLIDFFKLAGPQLDRIAAQPA